VDEDDIIVGKVEKTINWYDRKEDEKSSQVQKEEGSSGEKIEVEKGGEQVEEGKEDWSKERSSYVDESFEGIVMNKSLEKTPKFWKHYGKTFFRKFKITSPMYFSYPNMPMLVRGLIVVVTLSLALCIAGAAFTIKNVPIAISISLILGFRAKFRCIYRETLCNHF
jgi:hypothetical protein